MEWIEVTGRTLEEARERALDSLGVHASELEVEILTEPKSGFLGMGRTEARIRARVKPVSRDKPDERSRRRRGRKGRGQPSGGRAGPGRGRPREEPRDDETSHDDEVRTTGGGRGGSSRRGRGRAERDGSPTRRSEAEETDVQAEVSISQQRDAAVAFMEDLVEAFGFDADVAGAVLDEDTVEVTVEGDDLGVLIGRGGATLRALEDLTRAVVQRSTAGRSARVRVDVGGYRERRREALESFTRQVADEVRSSGTERVLEPMSPPDRKVVHDVIAEMDDLETVSEGEEPRRRIVIRPA